MCRTVHAALTGPLALPGLLALLEALVLVGLPAVAGALDPPLLLHS